ncbi:MAG: DNA-processing protein DprA [Anaerolineaceae bacterium]|nr:DNA-processing protein DprA [Anaerolineaceae bacterium]
MKAYWVAFNSVRGIGAARIRLLLEHFQDLEIAWNAPPDALKAAGLTDRLVENVITQRNQFDVEKYWQKLADHQITVLTWEDSAYPRRMLEIHNPPPVLYLRGNLLLDDEWAVCIVGTRRVTSYGRQVTRELATFLAQNGITVISGLARGVDSVAHKAALDAGGRTIGVLGCGVDQIYPPENRVLAVEMIQSGAVLSDYAPGTPPESSNFPPRNRIISGMSLATIVIEAGERSGALITATFAVEQGRDVFAVPGPIYAPQSVGCNRLIQQGAQPLLRPEELLDLLKLDRYPEQRKVREQFQVEPFERTILTMIRDEALHVDELCERCDEPVEKISSALIMMELKGLVRQESDMTYQAIMEARLSYGNQ